MTCSSCRHWFAVPNTPGDFGHAKAGDCREQIHLLAAPVEVPDVQMVSGVPTNVVKRGLSIQAVYLRTANEFPACGRYLKRLEVVN
jgi:hypothetical protein